MQNALRLSVGLANKAPAPNRRRRFPLGVSGRFEYTLCAPPYSTAAAGEAQRSAGP
jgi:hypothetical protein